MKLFVCISSLEKIKWYAWICFCFYTGWWLVPSRYDIFLTQIFVFDSTFLNHSKVPIFNSKFF